MDPADLTVSSSGSAPAHAAPIPGGPPDPLAFLFGTAPGDAATAGEMAAEANLLGFLGGTPSEVALVPSFPANFGQSAMARVFAPIGAQVFPSFRSAFPRDAVLRFGGSRGSGRILRTGRLSRGSRSFLRNFVIRFPRR